MGMEGSTPVASTNISFIINCLLTQFNFVQQHSAEADSPLVVSHGFPSRRLRTNRTTDYSWQEMLGKSAVTGFSHRSSAASSGKFLFADNPGVSPSMTTRTFLGTHLVDSTQNQGRP